VDNAGFPLGMPMGDLISTVKMRELDCAELFHFAAEGRVGVRLHRLVKIWE
jgi:hypothetical protein